MLRAASGPSGGWGPSPGEVGQGASVGLWSLGGPSAEVVTSEARPLEEALERRTRRTHCGRPCDNPGGKGCWLPRSPFGFACTSDSWRERPHAGHQLRRTNTVLRYAVVALGHEVSKSRFLSGVAHPRSESKRGWCQFLGCYMTMGLAHPSQRLGWSRMAWYSRMRVSSRRQGRLGPSRRKRPRYLAQ